MLGSQISVNSNNMDNIIRGDLRAKRNASGSQIIRYYIDFRHKALNLHKELSAPKLDILQNKVDSLMAAWDKKYEDKISSDKLQKGKELAESQTREDELRRDELKRILLSTLDHDDTVDWSALKIHKPFTVEHYPVPEPEAPATRFFGRAKRRRQYEADLAAWQQQRAEFDAEQARKKAAYDAHAAELNAVVEELRQAWLAGDPEAVIEHASLVLDASKYPDLIQKDYELAYNAEERSLLVDYQLPDPDDLPLIKNIRFVASTGEMKETRISQKDARELYDDICYQICLRTIHEIFESDSPKNIEHVAFNGITNTLNKATGKNSEAVILSIIINRADFLSINLARVDPKACFKSLKGVSAASLAGLAPVAPVVQMDKSDRRIVDGRSVEIDETGATNLAAMNWEEFEHFVRELFEKEFASRGGEVKVTQSSSDGGVDAIAYDPDPITGGKIVIQAKRYTKTVGVAAVRDLYGTTLSEGASRGILVTTSDYGPDAYKFCVDKPITLLSGANLLHLLEKHGMKAKIDLKEARKQMGLAGS